MYFLLLYLVQHAYWLRRDLETEYTSQREPNTLDQLALFTWSAVCILIAEKYAKMFSF